MSREELKQMEKKEKIEQQLKFIRETNEAKYQIVCMDRKKIKESTIPLQVIYNDKIERIRALEFTKGVGP